MVKDGVSRGFGTNLRQAMVKNSGNRIVAFLSGGAVTALLQSSTATTLILISFIKSGYLPAAIALAAIIGADVATTLVAQILTFDLKWLSPVLITGGFFIYSVFQTKGRERHLGRALLGVGLMLLALTLIRETSEPLKESEVLPLILQPLDKEPMLAIAVAAGLTYFLHSSLAVILLFAAMAGNHLITLDLGFHLVLGANIGGALIPFFDTYKEGIKVRRLTACNLIMRSTTLLLCLPFLPHMEGLMHEINRDPARQLVNFHTGFNIILAVLFLPLVHPLAKLGERLLSDAAESKDNTAPQYLDEAALANTTIALSNAARETLRMAELVETMLQLTITAFEKNNDRLIQSIRDMDNRVDRLNQAIKFYLMRLSQEKFDGEEADRYIEILTFATNLEYCGDVIDKGLLEVAIKKMRKQEQFSEQGFAEIRDYHKKVLENLRLAQSTFLSGDEDLAQQLIKSKKMMKEAEDESSRQHFRRLREQQARSVATSSMHLDILRDLRRINSYVTTIAFTVADNWARRRPEPKIP